MSSAVFSSILIVLIGTFTQTWGYDEIDLEVSSGALAKLLRAMVNQTKADTMTLPANATSIRENITDTFSCENRTYGYYADVDNECQIFHVCLPSQTPSGRNVTYRWSFICPNETIFNQEVMVCTRPRDAIDCADSPMYYYINMEIGKVPEETNEMEQSNTGNSMDGNSNANAVNNEASKQRVKIKQRRKSNKKAIMASLIEKVNEELDKEELFGEFNEPDMEDKIADVMTNSRLASERSLKFNERRLKRGDIRFKADV